MTILVDMNLSRLWCGFLSESGYETIHWSAVGAATASDEEIMSYAQRHGHVVFTEDLDFGILLARNRLTGPSVVQLRTGMNLPRQIGTRVVDALDQARPHLEAGALLSIGASHNRITVLPIG
jgi:predicted nuclease of predicted toxin-antitoxin system